MTDPGLEHDPTGNACYLRLTDRPIVRTIDTYPTVMVDVDADGQPVGVEVLLPPEP